MKATIIIGKSVGKNGVNRSKDVIIIQTRLNQWIAAGKLPGLVALAVDGKSGFLTRQAIGQFQVRYMTGIVNPDLRVDPGGKTATHLGLDYSQSNKPVGDPVNKVPMPTPDNNDDAPPIWQTRGRFWYGIGAKGSAGVGDGMDLTMAAMYNLKNDDNRFMIQVSTDRYFQLGAGVSGSFVLCFVTGIYDPKELSKIRDHSVDWNLSIGPKWLNFARWAAKLPKLEKLVSAITIGKYANGETVSELGTLLKSGMGAFGLNEDETYPSFVALDIPFAGGGLEASVYYGVTSYHILSTNLV